MSSTPDSRLRVLLVDDDLEGLHAMMMFIRSLGHTVEAVADGRSALAVAPAFTPHVVFLDIKLPDVDGHEVGRQLRRMPGMARAKVFALTGIPGLEERSANSGFDGHFAKPIDQGILESLLSAPGD